MFASGLAGRGYAPVGETMLARPVGGELIHVIRAKKLSKRIFDIHTTIRSVYAEGKGAAGLTDCSRMLYSFLPMELQCEIPWQSYCFVYEDDTLEDVLRGALREVEKLILPVYEKVGSLPAYIEYAVRERGDIGFDAFSRDGLVWVKTAGELDMDRLRKATGIPFDPDSYLREHYLDPLEEILNDPDRLAEAAAELERRKEAMTAFLRRKGIEMQ